MTNKRLTERFYVCLYIDFGFQDIKPVTERFGPSSYLKQAELNTLTRSPNVVADLGFPDCFDQGLICCPHADLTEPVGSEYGFLRSHGKKTCRQPLEHP